MDKEKAMSDDFLSAVKNEFKIENPGVVIVLDKDFDFSPGDTKKTPLLKINPGLQLRSAPLDCEADKQIQIYPIELPRVNFIKRGVNSYCCIQICDPYSCRLYCWPC